jgi:hypothetical protein
MYCTKLCILSALFALGLPYVPALGLPTGTLDNDELQVARQVQAFVLLPHERSAVLVRTIA